MPPPEYGFGKAWNVKTGTCADPQGTIGAYVIPGLAALYHATRETKYLDAARNACRFYRDRDLRHFRCTAGALDTYCIDKETSGPMLAGMPRGRVLSFGPGLHVIDEYVLSVPSDTRIHLESGAVLIGALVVQGAENVVIDGHGVVWQRSFHRYSSINGVRINHSRNVTVDGLTFLNPPHYTVHLDGCFLRTSDDSIAIYGSRWEYRGDARPVMVESCTLWADVAHPTIIGTHGDHAHDGDTLADIAFRNAMYEDIHVERIEHGKLIDIQIKRNPDYNPAPGRCIEHVTLRNIRCECVPPCDSVIAGYDPTRRVTDIILENVTAQGRLAIVREEDDTEQVTCEALL